MHIGASRGVVGKGHFWTALSLSLMGIKHNYVDSIENWFILMVLINSEIFLRKKEGIESFLDSNNWL